MRCPPPSASTTSPVVYSASTRRASGCAASGVAPTRRRGGAFRTYSAISAKPAAPAVQGVSTSPGATALTRIRGPSVLASSRVRCEIAALLTAYGIELPAGRCPAIEEMLTTQPDPDSRSAGTAATVVCQVPTTLTPRIRSEEQTSELQ